MKNVVVLGATGSLGIQMLKVLAKHNTKFKVVGITAKESEKLLFAQGAILGIKKSKISLNDVGKTKKMIQNKNVNIVINLISGIAGIMPTKIAIKAGKQVVLANKESIVVGALQNSIVKTKANYHTNLPPTLVIPIDSEHNAIYKILKQHPDKKIKKLILPASGGPFHKRKSLKGITAKEATTHPKWKMGKKISVESATLLNKGLEIIEAHYLFDIPIKDIEVVLHPPCTIHGMVEFKDGTLIGYFGKPNMAEHLENGLLQTIGETKKRKIYTMPLSKELAKKMEIKPFGKPNPLLAQGMDIVLKTFKKDPTKMKDFLKKEEKIINNFLNGKIAFEEIYKNLEV